MPAPHGFGSQAYPLPGRCRVWRRLSPYKCSGAPYKAAGAFVGGTTGVGIAVGSIPLIGAGLRQALRLRQNRRKRSGWQHAPCAPGCGQELGRAGGRLRVPDIRGTGSWPAWSACSLPWWGCSKPPRPAAAGRDWACRWPTPSARRSGTGSWPAWSACRHPWSGCSKPPGAGG